MHKHWKEIATLSDSVTRVWLGLNSSDDNFVARMMSREKSARFFTNNPPHENPLPLSLGREFCADEGRSLNELAVLPLYEIETDHHFFPVPAGVNCDTSDGTPYYDLFYNDDTEPVFVDMFGVEMLLVHFSEHEGEQAIIVVDPRCVDLES